jgi:hypothetical protein
MQMTQSSEAANGAHRFGKQSINLTNNNKIHGGEQSQREIEGEILNTYQIATATISL